MPDVLEPTIPICKVQFKGKPLCNTEMVRIGTVDNFVWVCEDCDKVQDYTAVLR